MYLPSYEILFEQENQTEERVKCALQWLHNMDLELPRKKKNQDDYFQITFEGNHFWGS